MAKQITYGKTPSDLKRMVDIANRRLRRIENEYSKKAGFENITGYAYHKAVRDIKAMGGKKRFSSRIPKSKREFNKMWNRINDFLTAPTSTLGGVRRVYERRAATIRERYGIDVGWENLGKVYESGLFQKLNTEYGSKSASTKIGQILQNKDEIEAVFTQANDFKYVEEITPFERSIDNKEFQHDLNTYENDIISFYESLY